MAHDDESFSEKPPMTELESAGHGENLPENLSAAEDFPEGGLRGWSVVLGVWLVQFCTFGYTNAYGVYNDFYVRDYLSENYTSSQISWIGSVQLLLVMSSGLFSGRLFDTGYFYHMMIGGSLLNIFCLFMLSLSKPEQYYQVFLAQGLGLGLATGITYVPSLAIIPHYFRRHRALALGIATTGSAMGGTVHPIILNIWFHNSVGFHNGVRASAGLNAGLLIIALCLMKPRLLPSPRKEGSILKTMGQFLREPPYVVMTLGTVCVLAGLYFPIFYFQLYAIEHGINATLAFYTLAILNGASIVGRVFPTFFVPKLGVFNVVIVCVAACTILVFFTLLVKTVVGIVIFAILYGFFSGAYVGLLAPMVGSLAQKDAEIGARLGTCFAFTGLGGLIGTPIAGALLTTHFIWWRPILFAGLCVGSGAILFSITRFMVSTRKGTQIL